MKYNEQEIVELYKTKNLAEIAKELNTYPTTIRRILIRNNVKTRTLSEELSQVKVNLFKDYDNPIVQYYIGLLASDGGLSSEKSNHRINLTLEKKDLESIQTYSTFTGISYTEYFHPTHQKYFYSVSFKNKENFNQLVDYGITPQKSENIKLKVPITWHILRGLIDGDGCITQKKHNQQPIIGFASASITLINQVREFLLNYNISFGFATNLRKNKLTMYNITISAFEDVKFVQYNLYNNATVFMKRKQLKLAQLVGNYKPKRPCITAKVRALPTPSEALKRELLETTIGESKQVML